MSLKNWNAPGPNFVPAYQISGIPFVTSSGDTEVGVTAIRVEFPYATRFFTVENHGDASDKKIRIGFTENGISASGSSDGTGRWGNNHYYVLPGGERTERIEVRCKELYIQLHDQTASYKVGFSVMAGLSQVPASQFPVITGSITLTGSRDQILGSGIPKFEGVG